MAVGAIPSSQYQPAAPMDAAQDDGRLPWPVACLIIGATSAALWSLIWSAIVALVG